MLKINKDYINPDEDNLFWFDWMYNADIANDITKTSQKILRNSVYGTQVNLYNRMLNLTIGAEL